MAGPNDLTVSLTIDTSVFQKNLDDAVKSLNDFSAKVKAAGDNVTKSMKDMKDSTDPLKAAFGELGSAIAAIGIGAFIESVIEGGAKISRLAQSVSMSTESVLEYSRAMASVGKDTNTLVTSFGFMEKAVEGAIQGNTRLRSDFEKLGISVTDFNKLTPEQTYEKIVQGLAGIQDPARRAQAAYDILGRSVKGVDWQQYARELENNKGKMADAAAGADAAAAAMNSFAKFIGDVKNQILALLAPILKFVSYVIDLSDSLGLAKFAGDALLGVFIGLTGLAMWKVFGQIATAVWGLSTAMGALLLEFAPIIGGFLAIVATAATVYAVYQKLTGQVDTIADGYSKLGTEIGGTVSDAWDKLNKLISTNTDNLKKNQQSGLPISNEKPVDPNAGAVQNLKNQYEIMKLTNEEAKKKLELEIALVGQSDTARAAAMANFENERKNLMEITKLDGDIAKLRAEQANKQGVNHGGEIAVLENMKKLEMDRYNNFKEQNSLLVQAKDIEKDRLSYQELYNKNQNIINDLNRKTQEITSTANQKRIAEVQKWADTEIASYAKIRQAEIGAGKDVTQDSEYIKRKSQIEELAKAQQDALQTNIDAGRDWNNSWKHSFNQYVEDAKDAATVAKQLFDDATKGMEDAIVNFAKTGKLSFSQLLQTIAEDILRSQIKSLFANLFTATGAAGATGGSMFGGLGKLLGFADGGTIPTNGPVLVGERGPEIISGAQGMNVTPNGAIGNAANTSTHVTYNINAVDSRSFQQMVAADPSFIYAVTVRGQNMIPGAR